MALPSKLKNFNVFNDGESYIGQVAEAQLPKLTRKMEEWRAGGMNRPLKIDHGGEAMQLEHTYGGMMRSILRQFGVTTHDGVQIRFAGAYVPEDTDEPMAVEVVIRGRHSEIDPGQAKPGEETVFKVVTEISYYKLTIDGEVIIEIDTVNMVEIVDGKDTLAKQRKAIGL